MRAKTEGIAPRLIRSSTSASRDVVSSPSVFVMPLSPAQITAVNEVVQILCTTPAGPRTKRKLGEMFMDLVDKDDLPEYYEV